MLRVGVSKMNEINFLVQGSAQDPYEVTFTKNGEKLTALCTCPAGINGRHCKHRLGIFEGSAKGIVSENEGDVNTVQKWLAGTDVEDAFNEVRKLEYLFESAKKDLTAAKRKLARLMKG